MTSIIRALNESSGAANNNGNGNGNNGGEGGEQRTTQEFMDRQVEVMYNRSLRAIGNNDVEEAIHYLSEVLDSLNKFTDNGSRPLTPRQYNVRDCSLLCLATLYTTSKAKDLNYALAVLRILSGLQPNSVTPWYRLGKIALQLREVYEAFDAFKTALECSPVHWPTIEEIIPLTYATHDLLGCLEYCAYGLNKDPGFIMGHVFRDHIFEAHAWTKNAVRDCNNERFDGLKKKTEKDLAAVSPQYLQKARDIMADMARKRLEAKKIERNEKYSCIDCPYVLTSMTLVELAKTVMKTYHYMDKEYQTLLRPVNMLTAMPQQSTVGTNEDGRDAMPVEQYYSQTESVRLEKYNTSPDQSAQNTGDSKQLPNGDNNCNAKDEKANPNNEEDSQTQVQVPISSQDLMMVDDESSQKKKGKKDLKWWHYEGQRRSKRVRGNIVSTSSGKPNPESTFAETLRNIIPEGLLLPKLDTAKDAEPVCKVSNSTGTFELNYKYFGSKDEERDVNNFLHNWNNTAILCIIVDFVTWISRKTTSPWPSDLLNVCRKLFDVYIESTATAKTSFNCEDIFTDYVVTFSVVAMMEIMSEQDVFVKKHGNTITVMGNRAELVREDEGNKELFIRLEWLKFKLYFKKSKTDPCALDIAKQRLHRLLGLLSNQPIDYVCMIPCEQDCVIAESVVREKIKFIRQLENVSQVKQLYQDKKFTELVEVLQFSLSGDSPDETQNRFYLAEAYSELGKMECLQQLPILLKSLKKKWTEELFVSFVTLAGNFWKKMRQAMTSRECKVMLDLVLKIVIQVEKQPNCTNELLMTEPWCILHSVLFHLEREESAFLLDEENAPNSVLVLQMGHEILSKQYKCCANGGHFLSYTISSLIEIQNCEEYWGFEETATCLEQAILCLYGHPNKKFKLKNLKDHGSEGVFLNWEACILLYNYYKLDELPEFDSKPNKSATSEVANLFERMIATIPESRKRQDRFIIVKQFIEDSYKDNAEEISPIPTDVLEFPLRDVFYLVGDYYFKNRDFEASLSFYMWDLSMCPIRFDSWTSVALIIAEEIVSKINACDTVKIDELITKVESVIRCFEQALKLQPDNGKVRIEFGSFLYAIHSVFSREMRFRKENIEPTIKEEMEKKVSNYLLKSQMLFDSRNSQKHTPNEDGTDEDDWINHFMLGKIMEKLFPLEPEKFLSQYELAAKLLYAKCSTYPAKINYYNPPDLALEALEIFFRIHSSIINYVKRTKEFCKGNEQVLLKYLKTADESPFNKSKQGRSVEGEQKKKKTGEDGVSRKEMAIVKNVVNRILDKVVEMEETLKGSSPSPSCASEESSSSNLESDNRPSTRISVMKDLSLSAFAAKLKEEDEKARRQSKQNVTAASKSEVQKTSSAKPSDANAYIRDFTDVPFGVVISKCIKGLKECVMRCPQYFKPYYRMADAYVFFKKDFRTAKEYLMGNTSPGPAKITGLFGERKPTNLFNGVWRNPIEDIDRPGSFGFYMSKCVKLLLVVLFELKDHQMLAEVGMQLSKVPDSKNTYLYTQDREEYCKEAFSLCEKAARQSIPNNPSDYKKCGLNVYETFTRLQKFSFKEPKDNIVGPVLLEVYKLILQRDQIPPKAITVNDAFKYFQHAVWQEKIAGSNKTAYNAARYVDNNFSKPAALGKPAETHNNTPKAAQVQDFLHESRQKVSQASNVAATSAGMSGLPGLSPLPMLFGQMMNFGPNAELNALMQYSYNNVIQQQLQQLLNPPVTQQSSKNSESKPQSSTVGSNKPGSCIPTPKGSSLPMLGAFSTPQGHKTTGDLKKGTKESAVTRPSVKTIKDHRMKGRPQSSPITPTPKSTPLSVESMAKEKPNISLNKMSLSTVGVLPKPKRNPNNGSMISTTTAPITSSPNTSISSVSSYQRTSPFQAQSSVLSSPNVMGQSAFGSPKTSSNPLPAHTQTSSSRLASSIPAHRISGMSLPKSHGRQSAPNNSSEIEVVDLTTKSPEKDAKKGQNSAVSLHIPKAVNSVSTRPAPLRLIDAAQSFGQFGRIVQSTIGLRGNQPSNLPKSRNTSPAALNNRNPGGIPSPRVVPLPSFSAGVINLVPGMRKSDFDATSLYTANIGRLFDSPNPSTRTVSSNISNINNNAARPRPQMIRPQKRPLPPSDSTMDHYPRPPKKKHQALTHAMGPVVSIQPDADAEAEFKKEDVDEPFASGNHFSGTSASDSIFCTEPKTD